MIKGALYPVNLLSHDDDPNWKVVRYVFTDAAPEVIGKMLPGFLVKFNATADGVLPALAADDAVIGGIIVDLPEPNHNPPDLTVAVALTGSFNQRQIHYANAWSQGSSPTPLSPAAIQRLRLIGIYLDPSVPAASFVP
jgi:hypothetical protein